MRIKLLQIENFKKFKRENFDFHPQFTLFAGENGAGKTSVLDALAVALGVWLVKTPDSTLANSRREISAAEIHLSAEAKGDRTQFRELRPVRIQATGQIGGMEDVSWTRQIRVDGKRTSNADAKEALKIVQNIYERDSAGENVLCPVLAYYGAGRAWLPSNQLTPKPHKNGPARRWAAFYDCFNERIRFDELQKWFSRESIERGNRNGQWRPGFEVVRQAVLNCVPDADDVRFDSDRDQIVLSICGSAHPFDNLSSGQRMMLALVADLAIKAVTQNSFLLKETRQNSGDQPLEVLRQTPGVVLIDELDVHLHPRWQRRAATDLKKTFPSIQFICTSHSPQVIGELKPEEIRLLDFDGVSRPPYAFGIDSSRVLEEIMHTSSRNDSVANLLQRIAKNIDEEDFPSARSLLSELEAAIGPGDPEVTRANALMHFLESEI